MDGLYLDDENQFQQMLLSGAVVWELKLIDGTIWVASTTGLYRIVNNGIELIEDISARTIEPSGKKNKL